MRTYHALLAAFVATFLLMGQLPSGAVAARSHNTRSAAARLSTDDEFESYAVRVNRAGESSFGGASRRDRFARGRMMQQLSCGAGLTTCGTVCVNTTSSVTNCGACGTVCDIGNNCCGGKCVSNNDNFNCGGCGNFCESGCVSGMCGYGS